MRRCLLLVVCLLCSGVAARAQTPDAGFAEVIELSGISQEQLRQAAAGQGGDAEAELLGRVLFRLQGFGDDELSRWRVEYSSKAPLEAGALYALNGSALLATPLAVADEPGDRPVARFECIVRLADGPEAVVLAEQVPKAWPTGEPIDEPVRFSAVYLGERRGDDAPVPVFLTPRLAWYPVGGVDRGWLLLARHGMDVALLDEVRHGEPFVPPSVSREGEAFYATLQAACGMRQTEIQVGAEQAVADSLEAWRGELGQRSRRGAIAAQVAEAADEGRSAVAPLFLQPGQETGKLVSLAGVARRAVHVSTRQPGNGVPGARDDFSCRGVDGYYEVELYTPDSQNLPVVCCLLDLPKGFPLGDRIREPARVSGFFFKSWRFRSRGELGPDGRGGRLPPPVVIGKTLRWQKPAETGPSRGSIVFGIGVLGVLIAVLIGWLRSVARGDKAARRRAKELLDGGAPIELPPGGEPEESGA